ncbi:hypothetical protein EON66_00130 [archaeon]|nr:MAG: hypothetical protein EON66_00130 [archaeon]
MQARFCVVARRSGVVLSHQGVPLTERGARKWVACLTARREDGLFALVLCPARCAQRVTTLSITLTPSWCCA